MSGPAFVRLPPFGSGQRIGLLGGSFNPPHAGHRHISDLAIRRLGLDHLWWVVTPGNPLKDPADLAALAERLAAARKIASHPRISVTGVESEIGSHYTVDLLRFLKARAPGAHFIWIMGADNLLQFPRWRGWREIAATVPIAVIDRPGSTLRAPFGRAAQALARWRVAEEQARKMQTAPALVFLHGPRSAMSSTAVRQGSTEAT